MSDLETRVESIKKRNEKVEKDKAWETSITRRVCIMILTYIVVVIYSYLVRNFDSILLISLVPVIGFGLSTLSLDLIEKIWETKRDKNK